MNRYWNTSITLRSLEDPLTDAEIERIYRWSRDENILRWSGGSPTELPLTDFRNRLRNDQRSHTIYRRAFVIVLPDGTIIGRVGVFAIDLGKREAELGISIGESTQWGKGYGRQAIQLLVDSVFQTTDLARIYLYTFPENIRAQRCFAACGFRALGVARRFSPDLGEYDGVEMEITRRDWLALTTAPESIKMQIPQNAKI